MGRADKGVSLAHGVGELRCDAKVRELDVPVVSQEDVAALDVAMHLAEGKKRGNGADRADGLRRQRHDPRGAAADPPANATRTANRERV